MLTWAVAKGYIADIPLPKAEMKGGAKKSDERNAGEQQEDVAE